MTTSVEEQLRPVLSPARRSPNVLIVDGDKYLRDLLRIHLSNAGYGVTLAEDAMVARSLLGAAAPDLLIIDAQMPYLNGLDFVCALLAESAAPRVPVVFVSSHEQFAPTAQVLGAGFLLKPFHKDELLSAVSRTLAGNAKQGQAQ